MVKGSTTPTWMASCQSLGESSTAPTRIGSGPILRKSSATSIRVAREPHLDLIRDKENDSCFEFLTDAKIKKLQGGYKPDEVGSQ